MKQIKILLALALFAGSFSLPASPPIPTKNRMFYPKGRWLEYDFNVHKRDYTFSSEFEIEHEGVQFAQAVKSIFHVRTHYDLYDEKGEFKAQGIHSFFPSYGLGWFYSWAADIDIYGKTGEYLGMIDGTVYTDASAKFNFYNSLNERVGIAYMDRELRNFIITDPKNSTHKIAELVRHYIEYETDFWTVRIFDKDAIAPELLEIFTVFACDRQDQFLEDN